MNDGGSGLGNNTNALASAIVDDGSRQRSDVFRRTPYEHKGSKLTAS